jgi:hypothetical protein
MPTNATIPTEASRKLFIVISPLPSAEPVPANGVTRRCTDSNLQRENYVLHAKIRVPKWQHQAQLVRDRLRSSGFDRFYDCCVRKRAYAAVLGGYFASLTAPGLSALPAVACSCPSSSHAGMLPDGIARFGR